jgi:hypothetical protein
MATILSKFLFSLSYRIATARYCFSRAKAFFHPIPVSIQTPIHACVTLQRITLSRYYSSSPLLRYLFPYTFAVIAPCSQQSLARQAVWQLNQAYCLRHVSPRTTNPHSIQHALYHHAQIALVINRFLKQNFLQLRLELITEHQSGHRKLVLLVVWEPQYYEFFYYLLFAYIKTSTDPSDKNLLL